MPQLPQALKRATPPLVVFMLLGLAGNGGFSLSPALSAPAGAPRVEFLFAAPKDGSNEVLQDPVGIACDAGRARIYVGDTNHHRVAVFNTLGAFLYDFKHWIKAAGGDRTLGTPARLLPWDGGTVLVADTASGSLDIMDIWGSVVGQIDLAPLFAHNDPVCPGSMAQDGAGNLYVVERASSQVLVLNHAATRLLRVLGGYGKTEGLFMSISDLAVAPDGTTYVLDMMGQPVVQVFDPTGHFVSAFGEHGDKASAFHHPTGIALDDAGRLWAADAFSHDVRCYTTSGEFLMSFGGMGTRPGEFYFPTALATGGGNLYVLEGAGARLQGFRLIGP